jgi:DNA-binding Lrp family transcriptional regulator
VSYLDTIDVELIDLAQHHFPLVREPYKAIAKKLSISEDEVLSRMRRLVAEGIVRDIGPVFDLTALGFASTLIALKVPSEGVDHAAAIINGNAGVSHNYEREGEYNLWFTLTAPSPEELAAALNEIVHSIQPEKSLNVPVRRVLKLRTNFLASQS